MADSTLGYTEPASPNKRLASKTWTQDSQTAHGQQIVVCDASGNVVNVVSNRLAVDASGVAVPVTDNSGSLTVDAPVGTPVFVRLSDGTSAIATLPVDTELPAAVALAESVANPTAPMVGAAGMLVHNASLTWDRQRSNSGANVLTSGARTTTQTGSDIANINWRGIHIIVNVTSAGSGSITPVIQGKDIANSVYYDLHAAATAITANGTYVYEIYPGVGAASGGVTQRTSGVLPRNFRVNVTHNNANTITYSVRYEGIV